MKIAVLNYTGTVGKTTIAAHLLAPRLQDARMFAVETINETAASNGLEVEKIRGEAFQALYRELMMTDDAIIDVGASNVEAFLSGLEGFDGAHVEIDLFVVPVTSGSKEKKETGALVIKLTEFGVAPEKIRLIFNRVKHDVEEEFGSLIQFADSDRLCIADPAAAIKENELFDMLASRNISLKSLIHDQTDYRAKLRALGKEGDEATAAHYIDMHVLKSLAVSVNRNLDGVFRALMQEARAHA